MKRVAIATGTRADWGLLLPLAQQLRAAGIETPVMATNMHLMPQFGMTIHQIIADGFEPAAEIPVDGSPEEIISQISSGFANAFNTINPDAVIILGDRFEMAAVALTAAVKGIPIIHIAGGTISEGAIDDSLRHAITKLSSLHLVETELCASRVVSMGEQPVTVIVTGALGVWNALNVPLMSRRELEESISCKLPQRFVTGTLHAATREHLSPAGQMQNFCQALGNVLEKQPDLGAILTYPNNDVDPKPLLIHLENLSERFGNRILLVPSLGMRRYLSAAALSEAVIGNSSSGIVEIPSLKVPVLDIGSRQQGRECSKAVIHCEPDTPHIETGIEFAISPKAKEIAKNTPNPYFKANTPGIMTEAILNRTFTRFPAKKFYPS